MHQDELLAVARPKNRSSPSGVVLLLDDGHLVLRGRVDIGKKLVDVVVVVVVRVVDDALIHLGRPKVVAVVSFVVRGSGRCLDVDVDRLAAHGASFLM